jgi:hypothetical protein
VPLAFAITSSVLPRTPTVSDAEPRDARSVPAFLPVTRQPRALSRSAYQATTASGSVFAGSVQSRAANAVSALPPVDVFGADARG